jgi:cyclohexanone monooxygenase
MEARGCQSVDTTPEWEGHWTREVQDAADRTLYKFADSWYLGANIPGKPRVMMMYVGGFNQYTQRCEEQASAGYEGFVFDGGRHALRL